MKDSLVVGYVPYSRDLSHPGDRRRLVVWANSKNLKLNISDPLKSDILVLSCESNFNYWIKKAECPVIIDLIDGYLGEKTHWLKDIGRNVIRSFNGTSNLKYITFTRALKIACKSSDAIIVSTQEQSETIKAFNENIYEILDDHSELSNGLIKINQYSENSEVRNFIFWEGFGYTLKHFKLISSELDDYLNSSSYRLCLVTNLTFARWGGYIGQVSTEDLIKKWFPKSFNKIIVVSWSIENLVMYANKSRFAIIPIDTSDTFANLKPENKLLGLWSLNLPVIFSDTPAYRRVASQANLIFAISQADGWAEALVSSEKIRSENYLISANKYLETHHSQSILIQKWDNAIRNTMSHTKSNSE